MKATKLSNKLQPHGNVIATQDGFNCRQDKCRSIQILGNYVENLFGSNAEAIKICLSQLLEEYRSQDVLNGLVEIDTEDNQEVDTKVAAAIGCSVLRSLKNLSSFTRFDFIRSIFHQALCLTICHLDTSLVNRTSLCHAIGISPQNTQVQRAWSKMNFFFKSHPDIHRGSTDAFFSLEQIEHIMGCELLKRQTRCDATSEEDKEIAKQYWAKCCEVSPNTKDVCVHVLADGSKVMVTKLYQYRRGNDIHEEFVEKTGIKMSYYIFNLCKPTYIRDGVMNTCLCVTCEEFRLLVRSVMRYKKLLKLRLQ
jgi:hypothetical protein